MRFCVRVTGSPQVIPQVLAGHDSPIGGKARSLARLEAAGWPVPPAFAITGELFRQLRRAGPPLPAGLRSAADLAVLERARDALLSAPFPAGFDEELRDSVARLAPRASGRAGDRLSVRSSFASEDRLGALAAGLFHSSVNVAVWSLHEAVRAVLASALSPAVFRYTTDRRLDLEDAGMAVLVHPFLPGDASGSAAWDPAASAPPLVEVSHPAIGAALPAPVRDKLDRALRELGRQHGPVEVEWVSRGDDVTFLQQRAYQPGKARPRWSGAAALGPGSWQWDAAHNPLPLSPAHADLIRLVDERCQLGFRQKVTGGYLFFSPDAGATALLTANTPTIIETTPVRKQLASLEVELGRRISALGPTPALEAALDLFSAIYQRLFAVLQPAARQAKAALQVFLETHLPDGRDTLPVLLGDVPSVASDRQRAAARVRAAVGAPVRLRAVKDYLARFGEEAPVWDVSAPTYREEPGLLERLPALPTADVGDATLTSPDGEMSWQRASRAIDARLPPAARAIWPRLLREARDAVAVAEEDDHLYARLQAVVRRALLREGERLRVEGILTAADQVFYLPLDRVRAHARRTSILSRDDAAAHLQRARNAEEAARRAPPPLPPSSARRAAGLAGDTIVYGLAGAGGRVVGRAFLYPAPAGVPGAVPDRTSIIVATTLLPAELPLVDAAAIVVETGGVLGHVAAQARERGIPAVVAAAGARGAIKFGDELLVDGDAGYVLRL